MPSASAKLEKQSSTESFDPIKQVLTLVDNKVRNLEKRKVKLDAYRADSSSGKELNEDQLNAVTKYDQVLEVLEFSREFQKSVKAISHDCAKQQKRAAKREMVERQQEQLQRLKELLLLQNLLNNMGTDEVRQDFLNQTNGAIKLSEEEMNNLDELYKLVSPERSSTESKDSPSFEDQLASAADHLMHLLDSRPKEVLGTSYKALKETLMKIHHSGYFDASSSTGAVEENSPEEELLEVPQAQEVVAVSSTPTTLPTMIEETFQQTTEELEQTEADDLIAAPQQTLQVENVYFGANGAGNYVTASVQTQQQPPLTDVLHGQAPINFLQDSQVDLESPHMDPAVVVAHPMAPPPPLGYHAVSFAAAPTVPQTGPGSAQVPSFEPIPTQTYTNQNFANLPNMVVPPASPYIPVNPAGNVNPMGLVGTVHSPVMTQPQSQPSPQPQQNQQPMRTSPDLSVQKQDTFMKVSPNEFQPSVNSNEISQAPAHYQSSDENEENCDGFQVQSGSSSRQQGYSSRGGGRGGPRGAPRSGTSNGYGGGRPRGSYSNNNSSSNTGGRGGYQGGNYYNTNRDFNNSNGRRGGPNPRGPGGRGSSRGGQGGAARGGRGGSGYRSQSQMQQQQ